MNESDLFTTGVSVKTAVGLGSLSLNGFVVYFKNTKLDNIPDNSIRILMLIHHPLLLF